MKPRTESFLPSALALSAVALWGLAFPLIQIGLDSFSPIMLGFVRFLLASVLMLVFILCRHTVRDMADALRKEWKPLLALGLLYVTIPNIAQNIGLQSGTSSIASVIQSSGPMMTLLFAMLLLKERMTAKKAVGTAVAMAGTIMLVASEGISMENDSFVSNILILTSAISYGLAWVSSKRMLERNPPLLVVGLAIVIGTAILGLFAPFEEDMAFELDSDSALNIAVLGLLCGAISSIFYFSSLEHQEVSKMAFFIYLMPVFASVFAWALRDEGVEAWTALCGVVIVIGIVIATHNGSRYRTDERASGAAR